MDHETRAELVELGLSPAEAQVYLALLQNASLSATEIASATGLSRSSVYQMLCSLADKGLVESGAGYGTKFATVAPDRALRSLVTRERETLSRREDLAGKLGDRFAAATMRGAEASQDELIQVLRNPQVIGERFDRLQLEAEREIDVWVKAPIVYVRKGNPAQAKAQRRGVHSRALYERAVIDHPEVQPFLHEWVESGEEARVYEGELPHKLAIFDKEIVVLPLVRQGDQNTPTLFIRHPQLAQTLCRAFESFWQSGKPLLVPGSRKKKATLGKRAAEKAGARNSSIKPGSPRQSLGTKNSSKEAARHSSSDEHKQKETNA